MLQNCLIELHNSHRANFSALPSLRIFSPFRILSVEIEWFLLCVLLSVLLSVLFLHFVQRLPSLFSVVFEFVEEVSLVAAAAHFVFVVVHFAFEAELSDVQAAHFVFVAVWSVADTDYYFAFEAEWSLAEAAHFAFVAVWSACFHFQAWLIHFLRKAVSHSPVF